LNLDSHIASRVLKALVLVVSLHACNDKGAGCFNGRGDQVEERVALEAFTELQVNGLVDVVLMEDSSDFAVVEYGSNVLPGITVEQSGSILEVSEANTCDWIRERDPLPRVEIHYTSLSKIDSKSAASISFDSPFQGDSLLFEISDVSGNVDLNVACNELNLIMHTGATDVRVAGTANYAYFYNASYAPLHAEDLVSRTVSVHNNGVADIHARGWETFYYQIYREGDIYAYGIANVVQWNNEGSGQLFLVED